MGWQSGMGSGGSFFLLSDSSFWFLASRQSSVAWTCGYADLTGVSSPRLQLAGLAGWLVPDPCSLVCSKSLGQLVLMGYWQSSEGVEVERPKKQNCHTDVSGIYYMPN